MSRVATYNVHDCIGRDGGYSPERIARVINELHAEVVALQEVTLDHAGDLIGYLETTTGMQAVDGTMFDRGVGRYGNVLLSRQRIADQRLHDLSFAGREPRGVIEASLTVDGGLLRVLATHLGLAGPERRDQLGRIAELLAENEQPSVLLGDFNVWLSRQPFNDIRDLGFVHTRTRSYPTFFPMLPLDRIFVGAPAVLEHAGRHDSPVSRIASDHFPVVAEVRIVA